MGSKEDFSVDSEANYNWRVDVSRLARYDFDTYYMEKDSIILPQFIINYRDSVIDKLRQKILGYFSFVGERPDPVLLLNNQLMVESVYWWTAASWNHTHKKSLGSCFYCDFADFQDDLTSLYCKKLEKTLNESLMSCNEHEPSYMSLNISRQRFFLKEWLDNFQPIALPYRRSWFEILTGASKIHNLLKIFGKYVDNKKPTSHLNEKEFFMLSQTVPLPLTKAIVAYVHLGRCGYCSDRFKEYKGEGFEVPVLVN